MDLAQADRWRTKLLHLEGIIAWNTREYIWKVLIGPEDPQLFDGFRRSIDPIRPLNPNQSLSPFIKEELTVYFFLKEKGRIVCRDYEEFLAANDIILP